MPYTLTKIRFISSVAKILTSSTSLNQYIFSNKTCTSTIKAINQWIEQSCTIKCTLILVRVAVQKLVELAMFLFNCVNLLIIVNNIFLKHDFWGEGARAPRL